MIQRKICYTMSHMNILVTGGAGYIGTHTLVELIAASHTPIVVDNLSNSSPEAIRRVEQITHTSITWYEHDVSDKQALDTVFATHAIDAVIHFAGLKAVGESVEKPLLYYCNNLISTLALLDAMQRYDVGRIIFSSSATVYGEPSELPLRETSRTGVGITNPYGWTKYMIEQILRDATVADTALSVTLLRYFNPVGAHDSGLIGEDPGGIPNNLMPYVSQVAIGARDKLTVNGNDYNTPDGTCLRDYIHVVDLARGHVAALTHATAGCEVFNLGTGAATSVLQLVTAFEKACGHDIPYIIGPRRAGDIAINYADPSKAQSVLKWRAEKTIEHACADSWRWQSMNPHGYNPEPVA